MANDFTLRASALPMAFRCPGSIRFATVRLNASNDAADNGTAAHAALRTLPTTRRIDWDRLPEIAREHRGDPDETRMLVALGTKLWNQVQDSFAGALTEVSMSYELVPGVLLTGHADLLAISQTSVRVGDWKTGRKDTDHSHQFKAYAAMALLSTEGIEEATGTGLWVRDQEIENYTMSRADAVRWAAALVSEVIHWDGVYRPGRHCLHCPRSHECEAANAMVRRDIAAVADKSLVARVECDLASMPAAEIVSVLQKADIVEKYAKRVRDAIRHYVEVNGDVVADGVRLTVVSEERRELDPLKAWPVLEAQGFGDEEMARVMRLSISEVEQVVRERTPRGQKKEAVEQLTEKLAASGAIARSTIQKLKEQRT